MSTNARGRRKRKTSSLIIKPLDSNFEMDVDHVSPSPSAAHSSATNSNVLSGGDDWQHVTFTQSNSDDHRAHSGDCTKKSRKSKKLKSSHYKCCQCKHGSCFTACFNSMRGVAFDSDGNDINEESVAASDVRLHQKVGDEINLDSSGHYSIIKKRTKCRKVKKCCLLTKSKCRYLYQHPVVRILTALILIVLNAFSYVEDPQSYSHVEASFAIFGPSFNFAFTKYPDREVHEIWFNFKVALVTVLPVIFILLNEMVVRRLICQKLLNIRFLKGHKGILAFGVTALVLSWWLGSMVFNDAIVNGTGKYGMFFKNQNVDKAKIDYTKSDKVVSIHSYKITDRLFMSDESLSEIARTLTFVGDFYTLFSIIDVVLQDKRRYPRFCHCLKTGAWDKIRIPLFWTSVLLVSIYVIVYNMSHYAFDMSWVRHHVGYESISATFGGTIGNNTGQHAVADADASSFWKGGANGSTFNVDGDIVSNLYINWFNIPNVGDKTLHLIHAVDVSKTKGIYQCEFANQTRDSYLSESMAYGSKHDWSDAKVGGRGIFGLNEVGRMAIAAMILILDVLVVTQDTTFPSFSETDDGDGDPKIPGLYSSSLKFPPFDTSDVKRCCSLYNVKHALLRAWHVMRWVCCLPSRLCNLSLFGGTSGSTNGYRHGYVSDRDNDDWFRNMPSSNDDDEDQRFDDIDVDSYSSFEFNQDETIYKDLERGITKNKTKKNVFITARWLTYGILLVVVFVDFAGLISQLAYVPEDYGQLVDMNGNIHTIYKDEDGLLLSTGSDRANTTYQRFGNFGRGHDWTSGDTPDGGTNIRRRREIYRYRELQTLCPRNVRNYQKSYSLPKIIWNKFSTIFNATYGIPLFQFDGNQSETVEYYPDVVYNDSEVYSKNKVVYHDRNKHYFIEYEPVWIGENILFEDLDESISRIDIPVKSSGITNDGRTTLERIAWSEVSFDGETNIYKSNKCKQRTLFFSNKIRCAMGKSEGRLVGNFEECEQNEALVDDTSSMRATLPCSQMEVNELIVLPKRKVKYDTLEEWKQNILSHVGNNPDTGDGDSKLLHQYYYFIKNVDPKKQPQPEVRECSLNYTSHGINGVDHFVRRALMKNPKHHLMSVDPNAAFGQRYYLTMDQKCIACSILKDIGFIFERRIPSYYERILNSHPSNFLDPLEEEIEDNEKSQDLYIRQRTHSCVLTYGPLNMYYSGEHEYIKFILCMLPITFLIIIFTRIISNYVLESLIHWLVRNRDKKKSGYYQNLQKREPRKKKKCARCRNRCKLLFKKCSHPLKYTILSCCNVMHCRKNPKDVHCCKSYDYFDGDSRDYEVL